MKMRFQKCWNPTACMSSPVCQTQFLRNIFTIPRQLLIKPCACFCDFWQLEEHIFVQVYFCSIQHHIPKTLQYGNQQHFLLPSCNFYHATGEWRKRYLLTSSVFLMQFSQQPENNSGRQTVLKKLITYSFLLEQWCYMTDPHHRQKQLLDAQ